MTGTVKIITPLTIATGGILVSTNVDTSADPAAYSAGTTYALAARVTVSETIYESRQAGNTGHTPVGDADDDWWVEVGPINMMAMFDRRVGSQTVFEDEIVVELEPGMVITDISALNVDAAAITVVQEDPTDGVVRTLTQSMVEPVADPWEWCFAPIERSTKALLSGWLPYPESTFTVTIDNTGGDAACGVLLIGQSLDAGGAQYGATDGIEDYSVIRKDGFGIRDYIERDYADDPEFSIWCKKDNSPRLWRALASRRALPTLIVLDESLPDAQYYGLPSFRRTFAYPEVHIFNVKQKGLT